MLPGNIFNDVCYASGANIESLGKSYQAIGFRTFNKSFSNNFNIFFFKLCLYITAIFFKQADRNSMVNIFFASYPFKITYVVIDFIAIFMVNVVNAIRIFYKRFSYKPMNIKMLIKSFIKKNYIMISILFASNILFKNFSDKRRSAIRNNRSSSNITSARYFIMIGKSFVSNFFPNYAHIFNLIVTKRGVSVYG